MINNILYDELKSIFPLINNSFSPNFMIHFQRVSCYAKITYNNEYNVEAFRNKKYNRNFKTKTGLINFLKMILW